MEPHRCQALRGPSSGVPNFSDYRASTSVASSLGTVSSESTAKAPSSYGSSGCALDRAPHSEACTRIVRPDQAVNSIATAFALSPDLIVEALMWV